MEYSIPLFVTIHLLHHCDFLYYTDFLVHLFIHQCPVINHYMTLRKLFNIVRHFLGLNFITKDL